MNIKIQQLLIILLLVTANAYGQEQWTLEKCIHYAIENNITIKQQEIVASNSSIAVQQHQWKQLPSVAASSNTSVSFGLSQDNSQFSSTQNSAISGSFGIGAQATLFSGLNTFYTIAKSKIDLKSALMDMEKAKNDIALNVAAAYLQVLFDQEQVDNAARQVELTKSQVERTQKLVDAGNLSISNLLEIQSQAAQEEVNLVNAQNLLSIDYLSLKQLLELPFNMEISVYKPDHLEVNEAYAIGSPSSIFEQAQGLPEIQSAELKVKSAETSIKIAKSGYYPSVSLSLNYGSSFFRPVDEMVYSTMSPIHTQIKNNQSTSIGLGIRIPIFSSMQNNFNVRSARLGYTSAQLTLQQAKNLLYTQVLKAHTDAAGALKKYLATNKAFQSFSETFKSVEVKFNVGSANSIDYNTAKNNLSKSESEMLQAKFNYIFKTKILDFYKGVPIKL